MHIEIENTVLNFICLAISIRFKRNNMIDISETWRVCIQDRLSFQSLSGEMEGRCSPTQQCQHFTINASFDSPWEIKVTSTLRGQCLCLSTIRCVNFVLVYRQHLLMNMVREKGQGWENMMNTLKNGEEIREHITNFILLGNCTEIQLCNCDSLSEVTWI